MCFETTFSLAVVVAQAMCLIYFTSCAALSIQTINRVEYT